jgi:hypothetical protein
MEGWDWIRGPWAPRGNGGHFGTLAESRHANEFGGGVGTKRQTLQDG